MAHKVIVFFLVLTLKQMTVISTPRGCVDVCGDNSPWCSLLLPQTLPPVMSSFFCSVIGTTCLKSCHQCIICEAQISEEEEGETEETEEEPASEEDDTTTAALPTAAPTTIAATTTAEATTTTLAPVNPVPIDIVTSFSSKSLGGDDPSWGVLRAIDGQADTLYHSDSNDAYAKFYIPNSKVTSVRIQNRADCCGERMTGETVSVCDGDLSCESCGAFSEVGNGEFGELTCGGDQGIQGNIVKVTSSGNAVLQIAEAQVSGQALVELNKLDILSATSSGEWSSGEYPISKSYDNNDETFYHSSGSDAFAKYGVAESNVTFVRIQNRPDCCQERILNNKVFVCADDSDSSCSECGTVVDPVAQKYWAVVACGGGEGIRGQYVKVTSSGEVLQITQIEIYANSE